MPYVAPENVTTSVEMIQHINNNWVEGFMFPGIIMSIYVIILGKQLTNPQNTFPKAFASASFICMILSVLARTLGLVNNVFMIVFIVLTALSAVIMHMSNQ